MTAWHLLAPMFFMCVVGSLMTYSETWREWPGYVWTMAVMGAMCSLLFAVAAKWLNDKEELYAYNLWWDALMMVAYYMLPLLLSGVRPSAGVMVGMFLVVVGMISVKVYS